MTVLILPQRFNRAFFPHLSHEVCSEHACSMLLFLAGSVHLPCSLVIVCMLWRVSCVAIAGAAVVKAYVLTANPKHLIRLLGCCFEPSYA